MRSEVQDTETTASGKAICVERVAWRRLPWVALLAALGAALINAMVYLAASGVGFIPKDLPVPTLYGEAPLTMVPVAISSVIGAIGGTLAFALIGAFSRRPVRLFAIVATVALVLSLATPPTVPGAPLSTIVSLMIMHVAAWAVIVGLLTTLARRRGLVERDTAQREAKGA